MTKFIRFPRTPHLQWNGDTPPRDDKLLSESEVDLFLQNDLVVEEKLDGTNLGISMDASGDLKFHTRGSFLSPPFRGQFESLRLWHSRHSDTLRQSVLPGMVIFGEWCYAKHSITYDRLQDWFYVFDVYSQSEGSFWSTIRRDALAQSAGLQVVPEIAFGRFSLAELRTFATDCSLVGPAMREGIYLRVQDDNFLIARAKLINPEFSAVIRKHWSKLKLQKNRLLTTVA